MFITLPQLSVALLTASLFGILLAQTVSIFTHRRYIKLTHSERNKFHYELEKQKTLLADEQETTLKLLDDLKLRTAAIHRFTYAMHHTKANPKLKSARGWLELVRITAARQDVQEYLRQAEKLIVEVENEWMHYADEISKLQ